jgi:hypothetical protein
MSLRLLCLLTVVGAASCTLIDPDITNFELGFPSHDFRLSSDDWDVPTGTVPPVSCNVGCENVESQFCSGDACSVDCDGTNCEGHASVSLLNTYNLATEAPEYRQIADQPIVEVSVDDIWFDITENTMNVATPDLNIYMAPVTVMNGSDPEAKLVGKINSIPAGFTGRGEVEFLPGGRENLASYMNDFHTPFNVIVSGTIDVSANESFPMGQIVGSVQAKAHAGL